MTVFNRTRERSDLNIEAFTVTKSGPGVPPGQELETAPRYKGSFIERIRDVSGPEYPGRDARGRCIPKPVAQWKVKASLGSLVPWYRWYDESRGLLQTIVPYDASFVPVGWEYFANPSRLEYDMTAPPQFLLRQHSLAALSQFETMFPEEISFPNFLWELREIGSLIPKIIDAFPKLLAGGYLNWEFGWKPFLADLGVLGNIMELVAKRLTALKQTRGKVTRLGYQADNWWQPDFPAHIYPSFSGTGIQVESRLSAVRSTLRVGALHRHDIPYLDDIVGTLRACIGALGLNNPLKTFWEALPFSFVVDYFLNVGSALGALTSFQDKTVPWEVWDVQWSMKTRATFDQFQVNEPFGQDRFWSRPVGKIEVLAYERSLGYPEGHWLAANGSLSAKQVSLLAALLAA